MKDRQVLELARRVCTRKQVIVLEMMADGLGYRMIARQLGISPQAVVARFEGAKRNLDPHLQKETDHATDA